ncbi:MAG: 3'-5' exonuclease [Acetobacter sp.]|nr:3'-5' exonuclease [Bacteroides sp.]MCM1340167.1 3'-5' exonuclease [Acetobacter sp.]MCM1432881.1 3'-5' exonuclease [Clostridiales bacterium]
MSRFVVFDVETPNRMSNRMSAIGITVIEKGVIADEFYSLVNPETYFDYFNVQLTGINDEMVSDAPTFPEVWRQIEPLMSSGLLVAHNAVFDMGVLKRCLSDYGIEWKSYIHYLCTVQMGRRLLPGMSHKLNVLCDYYGIYLNHHQAGSDSRACAEILLHRQKICKGREALQAGRQYSELAG